MCVFAQESERLRLAAFKIYEGILAKVKRGFLAFPLKHHILNLIVLLVLHLEDSNADVAQVRGRARGRSAGGAMPRVSLSLTTDRCAKRLEVAAALTPGSRLPALPAATDPHTVRCRGRGPHRRKSLRLAPAPRPGPSVAFSPKCSRPRDGGGLPGRVGGGVFWDGRAQRRAQGPRE